MNAEELDKMAEEYIEKNCKRWEEGELTVDEIVRLAYKDGAKENGVIWHKLKENSDDLPKVGVQVLSEQGTLVIYKGDGFNWVEYSTNAENIKLRKWEEPIAWCEIPQLKE